MAAVLSAQQPQFRADADLVSVDVAVHRGGSPVRNLTASDFRVTDNGVPQRIEVVEAAAMPVDVTLVVDLSARTSGALSGAMSEDQHREQLTRVIAQMTAILRPTDRLRLLTSDTYIAQVIPLKPVADLSAETRFSPPAALGLASTYDTLTAALVRADEPGRRHLVVAWAKPVDTISVVDASMLRTIAARSDAVLHVVERDLATVRPAGPDMIPSFDQRVSELLGGREPPEPDAPPESRLPRIELPRPLTAADLDVRDANGGRYFARNWRPFSRVEPALLPELAAVTGGTHRGLGAFGDPDAAEAFRRIFDEFRQGYVLRYHADGVRRDGRHQISVTVPAHPDATIRSRQAYTVDPASADRSPARMTPAAASPRLESPATIDDLVALFDRDDDVRFQAVARQSPVLRSLLDTYRSAETPWPADPRRESVFALLLGTAGLLSPDEGTRDAAGSLLARHHGLVRRPLAADRFECAWYRAAAAAATSAYLAEAVVEGTRHAIERCPADGRLRLARAVARDQLWSLDTARARSSDESTSGLGGSAMLREYEGIATEFPGVAGEARVRAAWVAYRLGNPARGLELVAEVPVRSPDRALDYFGSLIRGQILRRLNRVDDAIVAMRDALSAWPGAQSARVALIALLLDRGQRSEAERLSEAIQSAPVSQIDPWWVYWQGDYRTFSLQVQQLRELTR
jgi:VWFA-related protein